VLPTLFNISQTVWQYNISGDYMENIACEEKMALLKWFFFAAVNFIVSDNNMWSPYLMEVHMKKFISPWKQIFDPFR
jgi:hypothetical protein